VYADKAETFNRHVTDACKLADNGETRKILSIQTKSSPTDELEGETSNTESEENISATDSSNAVLHSFSPQKTSS
jgi:hypothetical protein